jgi:bifunctional DNA-binding transcriptional regulator/antitoxin component of YhaV-PrlF toxin-antitoxin module
MKATITMGSAGRLVLPKAMRDTLRLRPGFRLRAETVSDRKRGKRRVVVVPPGFDAVKAIAESRREHEDTIPASRTRK